MNRKMLKLFALFVACIFLLSFISLSEDPFPQGQDSGSSPEAPADISQQHSQQQVNYNEFSQNPDMWTLDNFQQLSPAEQAQFLNNNLGKLAQNSGFNDIANDFFSKGENLNKNPAIFDKFFSGSYQGATAEHLRDFLKAGDEQKKNAGSYFQKKYSAPYSFDEIAGDFSFDSAKGTLTNGEKTISLSEFKDDLSITQIISVSDGFKVVRKAVLQDGTEKEQEFSFAGGGSRGISYDSKSGKYAFTDSLGKKWELSASGSDPVNVYFGADGSFKVTGPVKGMISADNELRFVNFANKGELAITKDGSITSTDAIVETSLFYAQGNFEFSLKDMTFNAWDTGRDDRKTFIVDKPTWVRVQTLGQNKPASLKVHLAELSPDSEFNPKNLGPPKTAASSEDLEKIVDSIQQIKPLQGDLGKNAEVYIFKDAEGNVLVRAKGSVDVGFCNLAAGGVSLSGAEPHFTGENGKSEFDLLYGPTTQFYLRGKAKYSDSEYLAGFGQHGLRTLQDGASVKIMRNSGTSVDNIIAGCFGCEVGSTALDISKSVAVASKEGEDIYSTELKRVQLSAKVTESGLEYNWNEFISNLGTLAEAQNDGKSLVFGRGIALKSVSCEGSKQCNLLLQRNQEGLAQAFYEVYDPETKTVSKTVPMNTNLGSFSDTEAVFTSSENIEKINQVRTMLDKKDFQGMLNYFKSEPFAQDDALRSHMLKKTGIDIYKLGDKSYIDSVNKIHQGHQSMLKNIEQLKSRGIYLDENLQPIDEDSAKKIAEAMAKQRGVVFDEYTQARVAAARMNFESVLTEHKVCAGASACGVSANDVKQAQMQLVKEVKVRETSAGYREFQQQQEKRRQEELRKKVIDAADGTGGDEEFRSDLAEATVLGKSIESDERKRNRAKLTLDDYNRQLREIGSQHADAGSKLVQDPDDEELQNEYAALSAQYQMIHEFKQDQENDYRAINLRLENNKKRFSDINSNYQGDAVSQWAILNHAGKEEEANSLVLNTENVPPEIKQEMLKKSLGEKGTAQLFDVFKSEASEEEKQEQLELILGSSPEALRRAKALVQDYAHIPGEAGDEMQQNAVAAAAAIVNQVKSVQGAENAEKMPEFAAANDALWNYQMSLFEWRERDQRVKAAEAQRKKDQEDGIIGALDWYGTKSSNKLLQVIGAGAYGVGAVTGLVSGETGDAIKDYGQVLWNKEELEQQAKADRAALFNKGSDSVASVRQLLADYRTANPSATFGEALRDTGAHKLSELDPHIAAQTLLARGMTPDDNTKARVLRSEARDQQLLHGTYSPEALSIYQRIEWEYTEKSSIANEARDVLAKADQPGTFWISNKYQGMAAEIGTSIFGIEDLATLGLAAVAKVATTAMKIPKIASAAAKAGKALDAISDFNRAVTATEKTRDLYKEARFAMKVAEMGGDAAEIAKAEKALNTVRVAAKADWEAGLRGFISGERKIFLSPTKSGSLNRELEAALTVQRNAMKQAAEKQAELTSLLSKVSSGSEAAKRALNELEAVKKTYQDASAAVDNYNKIRKAVDDTAKITSKLKGAYRKTIGRPLLAEERAKESFRVLNAAETEFKNAVTAADDIAKVDVKYANAVIKAANQYKEVDRSPKIISAISKITRKITAGAEGTAAAKAAVRLSPQEAEAIVSAVGKLDEAGAVIKMDETPSGILIYYDPQTVPSALEADAAKVASLNENPSLTRDIRQEVKAIEEAEDLAAETVQLETRAVAESVRENLAAKKIGDFDEGIVPLVTREEIVISNPVSRSVDSPKPANVEEAMTSSELGTSSIFRRVPVEGEELKATGLDVIPEGVTQDNNAQRVLQLIEDVPKEKNVAVKTIAGNEFQGKIRYADDNVVVLDEFGQTREFKTAQLADVIPVKIPVERAAAERVVTSVTPEGKALQELRSRFEPLGAKWELAADGKLKYNLGGVAPDLKTDDFLREAERAEELMNQPGEKAVDDFLQQVDNIAVEGTGCPAGFSVGGAIAGMAINCVRVAAVPATEVTAVAVPQAQAKKIIEEAEATKEKVTKADWNEVSRLAQDAGKRDVLSPAEIESLRSSDLRVAEGGEGILLEYPEDVRALNPKIKKPSLVKIKHIEDPALAKIVNSYPDSAKYLNELAADGYAPRVYEWGENSYVVEKLEGKDLSTYLYDNADEALRARFAEAATPAARRAVRAEALRQLDLEAFSNAYDDLVKELVSRRIRVEDFGLENILVGPEGLKEGAKLKLIDAGLATRVDDPEVLRQFYRQRKLEVFEGDTGKILSAERAEELKLQKLGKTPVPEESGVRIKEGVAEWESLDPCTVAGGAIHGLAPCVSVSKVSAEVREVPAEMPLPAESGTRLILEELVNDVGAEALPIGQLDEVVSPEEIIDVDRVIAETDGVVVRSENNLYFIDEEGIHPVKMRADYSFAPMTINGQKVNVNLNAEQELALRSIYREVKSGQRNAEQLEAMDKFGLLLAESANDGKIYIQSGAGNLDHILINPHGSHAQYQQNVRQAVDNNENLGYLYQRFKEKGIEPRYTVKVPYPEKRKIEAAYQPGYEAIDGSFVEGSFTYRVFGSEDELLRYVSEELGRKITDAEEAKKIVSKVQVNGIAGHESAHHAFSRLLTDEQRKAFIEYVANTNDEAIVKAREFITSHPVYTRPPKMTDSDYQRMIANEIFAYRLDFHMQGIGLNRNLMLSPSGEELKLFEGFSVLPPKENRVPGSVFNLAAQPSKSLGDLSEGARFRVKLKDGASVEGLFARLEGDQVVFTRYQRREGIIGWFLSDKIEPGTKISISDIDTSSLIISGISGNTQMRFTTKKGSFFGLYAGDSPDGIKLMDDAGNQVIISRKGVDANSIIAQGERIEVKSADGVTAYSGRYLSENEYNLFIDVDGKVTRLRKNELDLSSLRKKVSEEISLGSKEPALKEISLEPTDADIAGRFPGIECPVSVGGAIAGMARAGNCRMEISRGEQILERSEGKDVRITSKSGNDYYGSYRGIVKDNEGKEFIQLEVPKSLPTGELTSRMLLLRKEKLNLNSVIPEGRFVRVTKNDGTVAFGTYVSEGDSFLMIEGFAPIPKNELKLDSVIAAGDKIELVSARGTPIRGTFASESGDYLFYLDENNLPKMARKSQLSSVNRIHEMPGVVDASFLDDNRRLFAKSPSYELDAPPDKPIVLKQVVFNNNGKLEVRIIEYSLNDRKVAEELGLIYENAPPSKLKRNQEYTYVLLDDGTLVFGEVQNNLEFGVKHVHLANGKPAKAAGELYIDSSGRYFFNMESGTYTKTLKEEFGVDEDILRKNMNDVFARYFGESGVSVEQPLLRLKQPTLDELVDICYRSRLSLPVCGKNTNLQLLVEQKYGQADMPSGVSDAVEPCAVAGTAIYGLAPCQTITELEEEFFTQGETMQGRESVKATESFQGADSRFDDVYVNVHGSHKQYIESYNRISQENPVLSRLHHKFAEEGIPEPKLTTGEGFRQRPDVMGVYDGSSEAMVYKLFESDEDVLENARVFFGYTGNDLEEAKRIIADKQLKTLAGHETAHHAYKHLSVEQRKKWVQLIEGDPNFEEARLFLRSEGYKEEDIVEELFTNRVHYAAFGEGSFGYTFVASEDELNILKEIGVLPLGFKRPSKAIYVGSGVYEISGKKYYRAKDGSWKQKRWWWFDKETTDTDLAHELYIEELNAGPGSLVLESCPVSVGGAVAGIACIPPRTPEVVIVLEYSSPQVIAVVEGYEETTSNLYTGVSKVNVDDVFQNPLLQEGENIYGAKAVAYIGDDGTLQVAFLTESEKTHHRQALGTIIGGKKGELVSNGEYDNYLIADLPERAFGFEFQYDKSKGKIIHIRENSQITNLQKSKGVNGWTLPDPVVDNIEEAVINRIDPELFDDSFFEMPVDQWVDRSKLPVAVN